MVIVRRLLLVILVVFLALSSNVFASNKEDLIIAINKTYSVGKETYTLPEDIRITAINYLRTHYFTEDECAEIISCINDAVAFANKLGTTDISKISADDLQTGINYAYKAVAIADKAPTIEEMEAKLAAEAQEKKQEVNEVKVEPKEEETVSDIVHEEEKDDVPVKPESNHANEVVADENTKVDNLENKVQSSSGTVYEVDEIDYSKYLTENQFVDANFEELKTKFIDEAKSQSFKMVLPYIFKFLLISLLIIIFIVIIFKRKKKTKEEN